MSTPLGEMKDLSYQSSIAKRRYLPNRLEAVFNFSRYVRK